VRSTIAWKDQAARLALQAFRRPGRLQSAQPTNIQQPRGETMTRIDAACRSRRDSGGFSLIELMIVSAIIGILAMIAVPSYDRYVVRSNRAVAKQFMLSAASKQEQYILDARTYATTVGALGLTAPAELATRYTFSFDACAAPCATYTIRAVAKGPQLADGDLTLDNLGTKAPADKWKN
jgi:type IV pilus assembly protein PilE